MLTLQTPCANCVTVGQDHIYVGCAEGIVRIFDPRTLHFLCTMPRPHYLGVDVAAGLDARLGVVHVVVIDK